MLISWSGNGNIEVTLPETMKNTVCGICGNYNDKPEDDLIIGPACNKSGTQARRVVLC
jgi:hypothetical protein